MPHRFGTLLIRTIYNSMLTSNFNITLTLLIGSGNIMIIIVISILVPFCRRKCGNNTT